MHRDLELLSPVYPLCAGERTRFFAIAVVNEVVPNAYLIARAQTILRQIVPRSPIGVKFSIEAVDKGVETSLSGGLLLEASLFAICPGTDHNKEDTSAFLEKSAPQFRGR